jgi:hypothetical protein
MRAPVFPIMNKQSVTAAHAGDQGVWTNIPVGMVRADPFEVISHIFTAILGHLSTNSSSVQSLSDTLAAIAE